MCISRLIVSESVFRYGNSGSFPERGGYEFTFQFFWDSIEEIMGREQMEGVLWWNVGKRC